MTKREAKAVKITRKMKNWNTGTNAMIMETPTFRCVIEAMDWMARECAKAYYDNVAIASVKENILKSILNAGKEEIHEE